MDIKAEDFPLYQVLVKNDEPGVALAKADFNAAVKGGDAEKYKFAFGIQTVAANIPVEEIPGMTEKMRDKTLRSCMKIFQQVAAGDSEKAADAQYMVNDFKRRGLGL